MGENDELHARCHHLLGHLPAPRGPAGTAAPSSSCSLLRAGKDPKSKDLLPPLPEDADDADPLIFARLELVMPAVPVDGEPGCTKLPEAEDTGTPMAAEPRSFCVRDMLALTLPTPTLPVVAAVVLEALEVAEFVAG